MGKTKKGYGWGPDPSFWYTGLTMQLIPRRKIPHQRKQLNGVCDAHVCVHVYGRVCTYAYDMGVHRCAFVCAHMHMHMGVHLCVHMCLCVCMHMCVCNC